MASTPPDASLRAFVVLGNDRAHIRFRLGVLFLLFYKESLVNHKNLSVG